MPGEVRDSVHGLIELEDREWRVVDTPAFQRLRRIQQLAMTHLVYPGARHSRFEHCMGACHVAGKLASTLASKDQLAASTERLRMAGLVHDIGHGPFSHVSEEVFEARTGRENVHEAISAAIVTHDESVRSALGDEEAQWTADLLGATGWAKKRSAARDIIAGPADVDKLDYLLRDSHHSGVEYGIYDIDKVIESARVLQSVGGFSSLAFDEGGVFAIEAMLLARYHMHRQIYGHRTRVATDRMLVRSMQLGIEESILPAEVFTPPQDMGPEFVREYLGWDDEAVIRRLSEHPETRSGQVMIALRNRILFKRVVRFSSQQLESQFNQPAAGAVVEPTEGVLDSLLPELEARIAEKAGVDPHWVSLYYEHLKNPISSRAGFRVFDTDVMIIMRDGRALPFKQVSEVFSETELLGRRFISVYVGGPQEMQFDEDAVDRIRKATFDALELVAERSMTI